MKREERDEVGGVGVGDNGKEAGEDNKGYK